MVKSLKEVLSRLRPGRGSRDRSAARTELSPIDLGEEILAAGEAYRAEAQAAASAIDTYEKDGTALAGAVAEQLAAFYDPERERAVEIQEAARSLSGQIRDLESILNQLREQIGFVGMALDGALLLNAMEMAALPPVSQPDSQSPAENLAYIHSFLEGLDEAQLRLTYLAARGINAGYDVGRTVGLVAELIKIREGKLAEYLGQAPPVNIRSQLAAARAVVATEGSFEFFGELGKEAALALGVNVPVAGLTISAIRMTLDIREKINALDAGYRRGEVDAMLDFRRQVASEDEAMKGLTSLLDQTRDTLLREL